MFAVMSAGERRRAARLPPPTERELERIEEIAKRLEATTDLRIDVEALRPRPRSKLNMATDKSSPRASTGSRLYDMLLLKKLRRAKVIPGLPEVEIPALPYHQVTTTIPDAAVARKKIELLEKARRRIARGARRYVAVVEVRERKRLLREQDERERAATRARIATRELACLRVQRLARGRAARTNCEAEKRIVVAARVAQRRRRRCVARRAARAARDALAALERAAVAAQRKRRGARDRRRARTVAAVRRADRLSAFVSRRAERRRNALRLHGAALSIQTRWRKRRFERVRRAKSRLSRARRAKSRLARAVRSFAERRRRRREGEARERAAAGLQRAARRKAAEREVARREFEKRARALARSKYRALKKVKLRGWKTAFCAAYRRRRRRTTAVAAAAATKIAATYRMWRAARRFRVLGLRNIVAEIAKKRESREAAASRVAAVARGVGARRRGRESREARRATRIQAGARRFFARKEARSRRARRAAAVAIQRIARGFLVVVPPDPRPLQAFARRVLARKKVIFLRKKLARRAEARAAARSGLSRRRRLAAVELATESCGAPRHYPGELQKVFALHAASSSDKIACTEVVKLARPLRSRRDVELAFARFGCGEKFVGFDEFRALIGADGVRLLVDHWLPAKGPVRALSEARVDALLSGAAVSAQRLVRGFARRRRLERSAATAAAERARQRRERAARRLQARLFRGPRAREKSTALCPSYVEYALTEAELRSFGIADEARSYWVHVPTGRRTWQKPRLAAVDASSSARPTPDTIFTVSCVKCAAAAATRACRACRDDAYCDACFEETHRRGTRRFHESRVIPTCGTCGGPATRACFTCAPLATTCDVCFHNSHSDHEWTPLVEPCGRCGDYAARWRCPACDDALFCAGCYRATHSRGARLAHACLRFGGGGGAKFSSSSSSGRRRRDPRDQQQRREKNIKKEAAALRIQAAWRRRVDRARGLKAMKERRGRSRAAWRRRKLDDITRNRVAYRLRDFVGLAPPLPSDTRRETVLKSIPAFRRARATAFILQNGDFWTPVTKRLPKVGFDAGDLEDLKLQAKVGGVLVPGVRATPRRGSRRVSTDRDLRGILLSGDRVRLGGKTLSTVESVAADHIVLEFCWVSRQRRRRGDLPIFRVQPVASSVRGRAVRTASRRIYASAPVQASIAAARDLVLSVARLERRFFGWKRAARRHEKLAKRIHWRLLAYQPFSRGGKEWSQAPNKQKQQHHHHHHLKARVAPPATYAELEARKQQAREDAYLGTTTTTTTTTTTKETTTTTSYSEWVVQTEEDGRRAWRNKATDDIVFEKPDDLKSEADLEFEQAKRRRRRRRRQVVV